VAKGLDGLLPKSFFACLKTFFDKSKACSRRFQNSPLGLNTVEIAYLPLRQDLLAQKVFNPEFVANGYCKTWILVLSTKFVDNLWITVKVTK